MSLLISVIMPTYNGERFVSAALESVRQQFTSDVEVVVVDDGSSDRTIEIVQKYATALSVRLFTPPKFGNWVAATNFGLRQARGQWACFLHQDDLWLRGRLERIRREIDRAEAPLIIHNSVFIGPDQRELGVWSCPLVPGSIPSVEFVEHLLVQNFIAIPSAVFRREVALESGGLDESLWFSADWDLWLRLGAMGSVRFLSEKLCAFRIHRDSQTISRKVAPNEWEEQLMTVLSRHLLTWPGNHRKKLQVQRAATASVNVNSTLAAKSRGESVQLASLGFQLLALGPRGWHRYLRDSRIVQRVRSRMKLRDERSQRELPFEISDEITTS